MNFSDFINDFKNNNTDVEKLQSFNDFEDFFSYYDSPHWSFMYTAFVIHAPCKFLEKNISTNPLYSYLYAKIVLNDRFPLGEKIIAKKSAEYSYLYAKNVLNGRFELGEKKIASDPEYACIYAIYVLKGRFELGERAIQKNDSLHKIYSEFCKKDVDILSEI